MLTLLWTGQGVHLLFSSTGALSESAGSLLIHVRYFLRGVRTIAGPEYVYRTWLEWVAIRFPQKVYSYRDMPGGPCLFNSTRTLSEKVGYLPVHAGHLFLGMRMMTGPEDVFCTWLKGGHEQFRRMFIRRHYADNCNINEQREDSKLVQLYL